MIDDNTIDLILNLGNSSQSVAELMEKLKGLKGSVTTTADGYEVLERQVGEYDVLERKVTETMKVQVTMLEQLDIQLEKHAGLYSVVTAEVNATGGAMSRSIGTPGSRGNPGMGILGASYAFQDFTSVLATGGDRSFMRALSSVQNNIPVLAMALGAGMGLAGAVSVVTVGVGLLIENWDKLTGNWKSEETKKEAERMKDLAKATDQAREAAEKLAKTLPQIQREGQKELQRAVDAFGGAAVIKELEEALKAKQGDFGAAANREMAMRFFQNLQQGNRQAQNLLADLDLRGPIGEVLRGGKTPKERQADMAKVLEKEAKDREAAHAKDKKAEEKQVKDKAKVDEDAGQADKRMAKRQEDLKKDREKEARDRAHKEAEAAGRGHEKAIGQVKGTDIDEQAAYAAAAMREQGGFVDKFGRFRRATPDQQGIELQRQIDAEIHRRFPDMNAKNRGVAAFRIGREANQAVDERLVQAQVNAANAGLDANQATLQAMQRMLQEFHELAARARMQAGQARALRQRQPAAVDPGVF